MSSSERSVVTPKYRPLYDCLVKKREEGHMSWHVSFKDVEYVIGDSLPPSARTRPIFWSNLRQLGRASTAWYYAGWKTSKVNMKTQTLVFLANP